MIASSEFQHYLQSIFTPLREDAQCWVRDRYVPTLAELPLRVQTFTSSTVNTQEQQKEKREQFMVVEGLRKYAPEHVLLVGKPGSGKSTALRRLLWEESRCCLEAIEQGQSEIPKIPILIELRGLSGSVLTEIREKLEVCLNLDEAKLKALLRERRLLMLLDGLNELPNDTAWKAVDKFIRLCADFKVPLILTTRELGSGLGHLIANRLEMLPLSEPQMREFLQKRLPETGEELLRQIQGRLRELAETPLLLQMLCDVFTEKGEIPKNRGELFRKEFARRYKEFKPERLRNISEDSRRFASDLLSYLAFTMVQGELHTDPSKPSGSWITISKAQAEKILATFLAGDQAKAKEWLEDLLEWHLLQVASEPDHIEFHHQLFQEYYAAEKLLEMLQQKHPDLTNDKRFQHHYLNYLKWTEPIAIMLGLPEITETQAKKLIELALDVDLMLGARLAGEVRPQFQEKTVASVIEKIRKQQVSPTYEMQLLASTHSDYAVSNLLAKFADENQNLIFESAFALKELGSRSAVRVLLPILECENQIAVIAALLVLEKLGNEEIIPNLQKALRHPNDNIREQAVGALSELGSQAVVADLIDFLKDQSYKVRNKAVEGLGNLGSEAAMLELLKIAIEDQSNYLRCISAIALRKINLEKATEELLNALKNKNNKIKIRQNAAEALGNVGNETAIEGLIAALEDGYIAWQVAEALVEIGSKKALPGLLKSLECPFACEQAAFVLGKLGDIAAVPNLINVLNHWDLQVREIAVDALGNLGDRTVIPKLYELLQDNLRNDLRREVVIALGKLSDERVCPELLEILEDQAFGSVPYWSGWWQVFDALEKIGGKQVVLALIRALRASNSQIRWSAAKALGSLGDHIAIDSLLTALADEDSIVRGQSAEALGKFDSQQIMPKLLPLLKDPNPNVRETVVQVLGHLKDESAVTELLNVLDDPEFGVRYDVAQSLVKLSNSKVKVDISKALAYPWKNKLLSDGFINSVQVIQINCQFYNSEIYQQADEAENLGFKNNFIKNFYKDIDKVIYQIQENPELRQKDTEDRLTIDIVNLLCSLGYDSSHELKIGGHVDLAVRTSDFVWLGEAKKYRDNNYLWEGFQQLTTRYSSGDSNQANGGLLIYIFDEDASSIMEKWQNYLLKKDLPNYSFRPCKMRSLAFISTHRHERSGQPFHVRHIPVILHFDPKDKSGRRRKELP
ncbi:MAG: HEAT repeat domain-containing protein [Fischerella sp. CENA71]|nr:HEAT repeat domain-containing protein [Fischerella sp. CENA71]